MFSAVAAEQIWLKLLPGLAGGGVVDADHRFDLESLMQQAAQEKQFLESTHKVRVTQDDIRKLLSKRRKKF